MMALSPYTSVSDGVVLGHHRGHAHEVVEGDERLASRCSGEAGAGGCFSCWSVSLSGAWAAG